MNGSSGTAFGVASGYAAVNAQAPGQQVGRIAQYSQEAEKGILQVHAEIADLETRVARFLRPTPPDPVNTGGESSALSASEHAEMLRGFSGEMQRAILRLRSISARLDI